jgi:peptidyl-prolyl cis-trans isomerase B (cyclophilin B)
MITIKTTLGDITLKLDDKNTPVTSENFLTYVREGFYTNTIFHRVIKGFMIQGGGLNEDMQTKSTKAPIQNEASSAQSNRRGTIAMARTMDPHSATAQFFINVVDNPFLNYSSNTTQGAGYCVFGEVTEGMDVVDQIVQAKTGSKHGHQDVPVEAIKIIEVVEH